MPTRSGLFGIALVVLFMAEPMVLWPGLEYGLAAIFFSVVNIWIELSLYAVAVRFLDYRFFLL